MWFASYLREKGVITGDEFADAVREQLLRRPILGKLAIQRGKLTIGEAMLVFLAQADSSEQPFGELAVELGFLSKEELAYLLAEQADSAPQLCEILVEIGALTSRQMLSELRKTRELRKTQQDAGYDACLSNWLSDPSDTPFEQGAHSLSLGLADWPATGALSDPASF